MRISNLICNIAREEQEEGKFSSENITQ